MLIYQSVCERDQPDYEAPEAARHGGIKQGSVSVIECIYITNLILSHIWVLFRI